MASTSRITRSGDANSSATRAPSKPIPPAAATGVTDAATYNQYSIEFIRPWCEDYIGFAAEFTASGGDINSRDALIEWLTSRPNMVAPSPEAIMKNYIERSSIPITPDDPRIPSMYHPADAPLQQPLAPSPSPSSSQPPSTSTALNATKPSLIAANASTIDLSNEEELDIDDENDLSFNGDDGVGIKPVPPASTGAPAPAKRKVGRSATATSSPSPNKRQKSTVALTTIDCDSASTATSPLVVMCQHCDHVALRSESPGHTCPKCSLRRNLDYDASQNKDIRNRADALIGQLTAASNAATAASTASAAASAASASRSGQSTTLEGGGLSKRDRELYRLADNGRPHPSFASTESMTAAQAFSLNSKAWGASGYQPASEATIRLVQSGKLVHICIAVPKLIVDADRNGSSNDVLTISNLGQLSAGASLITVPSVELSFISFVSAIFNTIIPALVGHPSAMMDWITLASTVLELYRTRSWNVAATYLDQVLTQHVDRRESFGAADNMIIQLTMTMSSYAASSSSSSSAAAASSNSSNHVGAVDRPKSGNPCHNWNFSMCSMDQATCYHGHYCWFSAKCNNKSAVAGVSHKGITCVKKTDPLPPKPLPKGSRNKNGSGRGGQ